MDFYQTQSRAVLFKPYEAKLFASGQEFGQSTAVPVLATHLGPVWLCGLYHHQRTGAILPVSSRSILSG